MQVVTVNFLFIFLWKGNLQYLSVLTCFLICFVTVDFSVECEEETVTVSWPMGLQNQPDIDPSHVRLGYCTPDSNSVIPGGARAVFEFKEWRCGAEMMVSTA